MAVEPFWYHFWTFDIFELFDANIAFFGQIFGVFGLLRFWGAFSINKLAFSNNIFLSGFPGEEIALKFPDYEI